MTARDPFGFVGHVLEAQFRVDAVGGEGGFSVVYRGFHLGLGEPVAIKCLKLPPSVGGALGDMFIQRFRDESRLLYKLSQGNLHIVRSIAAGAALAPATHAVVPYMVLEWLDGRSVASEVDERHGRGMRGRGLEGAVHLMAGAADALSYAHSQGVVHRDLNPGNFMIVETPQGPTVKVLDFGVAKVLHDSTLALGQRAATVGHVRIFAPGYGAPEQFDHDLGPVGPWSDVYSFALVILEVARDQAVITGEHLGEYAQKAVDPKLRPTPRAVGLSVTDEVEAVFARAVALRPTDRYPDVRTFFSALRAALQAEGEGPTRVAIAPSLQATLPIGSASPMGVSGSVPDLSDPDVPHTVRMESPLEQGDADRGPMTLPETAPEIAVPPAFGAAQAGSGALPAASSGGYAAASGGYAASSGGYGASSGSYAASSGPHPSAGPYAGDAPHGPPPHWPVGPQPAGPRLPEPMSDPRAAEVAGPPPHPFARQHAHAGSGGWPASPHGAPALAESGGHPHFVGAPPADDRGRKTLLVVVASSVAAVVVGVALFVLFGRSRHEPPGGDAPSKPAVVTTSEPAPPPPPAAPPPAPPPAADPSASPEAPPEAPPPPKVSPPPDRPRPPSTSPSADEPGPTPAKPRPSASVAPPAPGDVDDPYAGFDARSAKRKLEVQNGVLAFCKSKGGLSGPGTATVTFQPTGAVSRVDVEPPYAGTSEGKCIAGQFSRVKIAPYTGSPATLKHGFTLPK